MIPVALQPEADRFDAEVRVPGNAWLAEHATGEPPSLWNRVKLDFADAYRHMCAYTAMYLSAPATVDHFAPVASADGRRLAYEWSNYRYCVGWLNSSKQNEPAENLLDPFHVGAGWFEVILPSLQLRVSEACPAEVRARAAYTIRRLRLDHDERSVRTRRAWLAQYEAERIDLDGLERFAPLVGQAVRRAQSA